MATGYESTIDDISYLLSVASAWHRNQFGDLVAARIKKEKNGFRCFDRAGEELSLSEVHRRSQASAEIQRSVYNLWMSYAK
jgi:hypothetical protein